ncbi:YncE family protein [Pseudonocardia pini]|uniref:YncE family protein n=1 Tax=Pseudonocardia pini TaxID=2758030 RepID=UPI001FEBDC95|nr:copper oxidase [Pseudonocardia pini]
MSESAPQGLLGSRKRRRLAAISAVAAAAVGATAVVAGPAIGQQPVGVAPLPITFDITDENGGWFDSGLNLFGSKSLAVAVLPRAGTAASAVGGVPSLGGPLLPTDTSIVDNITGGLAGGAGDPLALDSTLAAVQNLGKSSPEAAPQAAKAEDLIGQLKTIVGGMPAGVPIDLSTLPVGVDLMGVLDSLTEFAVEGPAVTVTFNVDPAKSEGIRNPIGLIAPEGAAEFPYMDAKGAFYGKKTIQLDKPGLYAFTDSVAPYMLGAVVVDDPLTLGLDFGEKLVVNGKPEPVASNSDVIQRLVNAFFTITNPGNWQKFSTTEDVAWNPVQPPAPILQYDPAGKPVLIPNLDAYFDQKFSYPKTLAKVTAPKTPGVGEAWIATQMEDFAGKAKHGSLTKVDVENWTIDRKIAAPEINMNNVHNMWTDKDYKYVYGNEWFDNETDVFDRVTGKFIRSLEVGPNPAHVMTRPDNDNLTIGVNAGTDIVEAAPGATGIVQRIHTDPESGMTPHPHAHWTSHDGKTVVAPNTMTNEAVIADLDSGTVRHEPVGAFPIATSMTPDSKKAYLSDFLGMSISCVSLAEDACATPQGDVAKLSTIDLWKNYDPQTGPSGPWGGLTIQLPVSPDGKAMLAANTLSQTISVIDPTTNKVIKDLPCNAGCHGGNFGAKQGGGYYAYITNKFSNAAQVVDVDPNNDGNIADAAVAGQLVLDPTADTKMDDKLVANPGQGGQGIVAIPLVYNGWSQNIPEAWRKGLTPEQINPIGSGS